MPFLDECENPLLSNIYTQLESQMYHNCIERALSLSQACKITRFRFCVGISEPKTGMNTNTLRVKFIWSKGKEEKDEEQNRAGVDNSDRRIYSSMPPNHKCRCGWTLTGETWPQGSRRMKSVIRISMEPSLTTFHFSNTPSIAVTRKPSLSFSRYWVLEWNQQICLDVF